MKRMQYRRLENRLKVAVSISINVISSHQYPLYKLVMKGVG